MFGIFQSTFAQTIKLQIPLPGMDDEITVCEGGSCSGIATYVSTIAQWIVAALSVLAMLFIMIGGIIWLTSRANPKQAEFAKKIITDSIFGLTIALGSYMLLATISPSLVSFSEIKLEKISHMDFQINQIKLSDEFDKLHIPAGQKTKAVCSAIMSNSNLSIYKSIGAELNFPWEALAALHYLECKNVRWPTGECGNNAGQFTPWNKFEKNQSGGCLTSLETNLRCAIKYQIRGQQGMNVTIANSDTGLLTKMFTQYNGSKAYALNDPDNGNIYTFPGGYSEDKKTHAKIIVQRGPMHRPGAIPVYSALKNNCQ